LIRAASYAPVDRDKWKLRFYGSAGDRRPDRSGPQRAADRLAAFVAQRYQY
jgi:hypothetical protein